MPSPRERALLKEDDVKIVRMPLSAVTSGPDIGISPHAVDQYYEQSSVTLNFPNEKSTPPTMRALIKII